MELRVAFSLSFFRENNKEQSKKKTKTNDKKKQIELCTWENGKTEEGRIGRGEREREGGGELKSKKRIKENVNDSAGFIHRSPGSSLRFLNSSKCTVQSNNNTKLSLPELYLNKFYNSHSNILLSKFNKVPDFFYSFLYLRLKLFHCTIK